MMRRRNKIKLNPKQVLIACTVLLVGLIVFSFKFGEQLSPVKDAVGTVVTPMQRGINSVGTYISDRIANLKSNKQLQNENAKLKEQVDTLSYTNNLLLQDKYELDELRKLYKLDQKYMDYPKVAAHVIGKGTSNWYNIFTIDKGTRDGLKKHMNVIAGDGLVGELIEVHYNYSTVRAIIDDNSMVYGMFLKTSDEGTVQGDLQLMDNGKIRVKMINKSAEITDGDEMVTSRNSSNFLQGISIGYVSDIKMASDNLTKTALLTPTVDFSHLQDVLIITKLNEPLIDKIKK
jgi:rod shape-determining protein MreC